jgi:hypothetical protein
MRSRLLLLIAFPAIATLAPINTHASSKTLEMQSGVQSWRAEKCAVFQETRNEISSAFAGKRLGAEFVEAEENYIKNGCAGRAYACPKSASELDYANQMSFSMMSHGLSGTFLPYGCKAKAQ